MATFLISTLENHLSARHKLTKQGAAILKFDKGLVWRLADHARNAPVSQTSTPVMGYLAAEARGMTIGPNILILPPLNPVHVAEETADA